MQPLDLDYAAMWAELRAEVARLLDRRHAADDERRLAAELVRLRIGSQPEFSDERDAEDIVREAISRARWERLARDRQRQEQI